MDVPKEGKATEPEGGLAQQRLEQLKYLQADFDNYRKKFDREREDIIKFANESLVKDFLPILDDFEGALTTEKSDGLVALHAKILKVLYNAGLRSIDALGKEFDPHLHEALLRVKNGAPEGTVIEELRKGYSLRGKVIRPSGVKVSVGDKISQ